MRLKLSKMYVLSLYAALIGQTCMLIGLPFQIAFLTTLGTYSIVGASLLCVVTWFVNDKYDNGIGKLLLVVLTFFTLCSVVYSWVFSYSVFVRVITFLELPIFLLTADKIKSKVVKNFIYAFNMLYPVLFGVLLASPMSHRYYGEYGMITHENITLGYGNPNETAIYLLFNFIILFAAVFKFKNVFFKILCLVEAVFVGYLIFHTASRAAIVIAITVVLASVILKKIKLNGPILLGVFAIPIFFFFILRWFPDVTILGEAFDTGRSEMYEIIFTQLDFGKFLLGDFASFELGNAHNALLSIFASLGVVSTIFFVIILYRQAKNLGKTVAFKEKKVLLISVLAIIIHSSVEAAVFVSGTAYASLFFMLYYLCLDDSEMTEGPLNENTAR